MPFYEYRGDEPGLKARMGRKPRPFDPALCGTGKGIWQHRRAGEPNCQKCKDAYNAKRRQARAKKAEEGSPWNMG